MGLFDTEEEEILKDSMILSLSFTQKKGMCKG